MRFLPLLLWSLLLATTIGAQQRGPILKSDLTPAEVDRELERFEEELTAAGLRPSYIESSVNRARAAFAESPRAFKDDDRLALFPEIIDSDELLYSCYVALTRPQTETLFYTSPRPGENAIDTKTLRCTVEPEEMYCSLREEKALIYDDSGNYFFVDPPLDEDEARMVAALFVAQAPTNLVLDRISKRDDEYVFTLGNCGCWGERVARLDTSGAEPRLEFLLPEGDQIIDACV
jgi:hypothetical protein